MRDVHTLDDATGFPIYPHKRIGGVHVRPNQGPIKGPFLLDLKS
jgi:hypothetical protein